MKHGSERAEPPSGDAVEQLIDEVGCYLEAVALFRALGHEPRWRSEAASGSRVIALIAPYIDRVSAV